MLLFALSLFLIATIGYAFASGIAIYYLRIYRPPGESFPVFPVTLFAVTAALFWLLAFSFLIRVNS